MSARRLPRTGRSVREIARRLDIPRRHKVEYARAMHGVHHRLKAGFLVCGLLFLPHKRRIPNHVIAQLRQQHRRPVDA